ncbi:hypothetical protein Patl1_33821 [Pistacia atlantica]|uniref:Uncharacterized protein n=1 Tax=Pistacia atlantica TaxID=434234 RepID=A0ACC0ZT07_9ROSI|nr:hypothetical protein Patl1_33821 [Pistacia atlantica]
MGTPQNFLKLLGVLWGMKSRRQSLISSIMVDF